MRVKDAFDVLEQTTPPQGVTLERLDSTNLHLHFPLPNDNKSDLDAASVPIIMGIILLFAVLGLFNAGQGMLAFILLAFVGSYVVRKGRELIQDNNFTHLSLQLSSKGGYVYKTAKEADKKLLAYYSWGEIIAVSVKEVPKSKEKPAPYYIYLQTKGYDSNVHLFMGQLSTEEIIYVASMLEALLAQRYRGEVPHNWRKELKELGEPMQVDWSDHLIED